MDLFDLLFDLIGLLIGLIGKFWMLILIFLGYTLFGKSRGYKKRTPTMRPPVLTPVYSPEAPREVSESRRNEASYPPVETKTAEEDTVLTTQAANPLIPSAAIEPAVDSSEEPAPPDPREAMKWAMIFSEPRAKAPYSPPRKFIKYK